ncbi:MAG TPA: hypothetical protein VF331_05755 [Polyangiales bacterium]
MGLPERYAAAWGFIRKPMTRHNTLPTMLLALALGCGVRSHFDAGAAPSASGGGDASLVSPDGPAIDRHTATGALDSDAGAELHDAHVGADGSGDLAIADAGNEDAGGLDAAADSGTLSYTSWDECGWSDPACTCAGVLACAAAAGGAFSSLGSSQARVCGVTGDDCIIDVFAETEGGGLARRCLVPRAQLACASGAVAIRDEWCMPLFSCNLLMANCPSDVMPGQSVIACR